MALEEYKKKRKFSATPEPKPAAKTTHKPTTGGTFCVQRHDASHLHYDFRLEAGGVLVSWAVPKGPSLDPTRKPLAMKVEDHPLDYGGFEGTIPAGNYGAGSVMLWDRGTYEVIGESAEEQLARGDFKFSLDGTKLKGSFAIVRMKRGEKGNEWLLIKKPDEFAVPGYDIEKQAWSVITKRTQAEIAAGVSAISLADLAGAHEAALPASIEPMLATLASAPPKGPQWVYEIKWDGVRALCFIEQGKLRIDSRTKKRCEQQYPELAGLPDQIEAKSAILDGEIGVLDEHGRARFELIQPRISIKGPTIRSLAETSPATLFLFDILYLDGYDLRGVPLEHRRRLLRRVVTENERVRLSEWYEADGGHMLEAARERGLEGVIAKDRHSPYVGRRSKHWLKLKVVGEEEFVIAGFTPGEREHFGALILGVQEQDRLRHVGQVGTGFDQKKMKEIAGLLKPLVTSDCPLTPKPKIKATWTRPEIVCQIRFLEWTQDGMLRAPVFVRLLDDKAPEEDKTSKEDKASKEVAREEVAREEPETTEEPATVSAHDSLDLPGSEAIVEVDGHRLKLSNLDKIFYPQEKYTKRDLIEFYDRVSPWLLPHLKDRPLSLKRYPNGIDGQYFFQKNASEHFAEWIRREPVREGHPPKTLQYVVANDRATLLYLINLGCIDHNPWMSRAGSLEHPDWMLIDLDPVDCSFDRIVEAAQIVRDVLNRLGLRGYPKTTGGDGLHIYVPLQPVYSFDQVRSFAEITAHFAVDQAPDLFTTPRSVGKRKKDRVYFDWQQIATGKTIAAPYVLRAYPGAPVATPLKWEEVQKGIRPMIFICGMPLPVSKRWATYLRRCSKGGSGSKTRYGGGREEFRGQFHAAGLFSRGFLAGSLHRRRLGHQRPNFLHTFSRPGRHCAAIRNRVN